MQNTLLSKRKISWRFATLMELYEQNYMLIRLLAPSLRDMHESSYVSQPSGLLALEISDIEHNRYTSTFKLTYRFSSVNRLAREPDLTIRLYHDARACEVMSGLIPSTKNEGRRTRDLEQGYRLNRFLHRWVSYCLRQGHSFDQQQSASQAAKQYDAAAPPEEAPSHPNVLFTQATRR